MLGHRGEERLEHLDGELRPLDQVPQRVAHRLGDAAAGIREQADAFGEEAEDDPVQEAGDDRGILPVAVAQHGGDFAELLRRGLGDVAGVVVRMQVFRSGEDIAQNAPEVGGVFAQVPVAERDDARRGVGEVGVDFEAAHVADDQ